MKQSLDEARRLINKYEGVFVIPPLIRVSKLDSKIMTKPKPTMSSPVEHHGFTPQTSSTKASNSKVSGKRKRR